MNAYEHFFFRYKSSDLLVIETSEIDFVDRNEDLQELLNRLTQPVIGTQYFYRLDPLRRTETGKLGGRTAALDISRVKARRISHTLSVQAVGGPWDHQARNYQRRKPPVLRGLLFLAESSRF